MLSHNFLPISQGGAETEFLETRLSWSFACLKTLAFKAAIDEHGPHLKIPFIFGRDSLLVSQKSFSDCQSELNLKITDIWRIALIEVERLSMSSFSLRSYRMGLHTIIFRRPFAI